MPNKPVLPAVTAGRNVEEHLQRPRPPVSTGPSSMKAILTRAAGQRPLPDGLGHLRERQRREARLHLVGFGHRRRGHAVLGHLHDDPGHLGGNGTVIEPGATIKTAGFRFFCAGELINNGAIQSNGNAAVTNTAGAALSLLGNPISGTTVGYSGGAGQTPRPPTTGPTRPNCLGGVRGSRGASAVGANAGGTGGTVTAPHPPSKCRLLLTLALLGRAETGTGTASAPDGRNRGGFGERETRPTSLELVAEGRGWHRHLCAQPSVAQDPSPPPVAAGGAAAGCRELGAEVEAGAEAAWSSSSPRSVPVAVSGARHVIAGQTITAAGGAA